MQNIDYKCELRDPELVRAILRKRGAMLVGDAQHDDTYYRVPDGRLKRRAARGEPVEWIVYHRSDRALPRISRFTIYSEDQLYERYGRRSLPEWVRFTKRREVWLLDGVRVHVDHIDGLGWFLEIDALVSTSRNVARCHEIIAKVRKDLAPALGGGIATSYADLVALEHQLGEEGNVEEPEWFRNWAPPLAQAERLSFDADPDDTTGADDAGNSSDAA
jgi:adenylate cyclase class IV